MYVSIASLFGVVYLMTFMYCFEIEVWEYVVESAAQNRYVAWDDNGVHSGYVK